MKNVVELKTGILYDLKDIIESKNCKYSSLALTDLPNFTLEELRVLSDKNFAERISFILKKFFPSFELKNLQAYCERTFCDFEDEDPTAVISLSEEEFVLELNKGKNSSLCDVYNCLTSFLKNEFFIASDSLFELFGIITYISCFTSTYCDFVSGEIISLGEKINVALPVKHLPLATACIYAKKLGLPINKIIFGDDTEVIFNFLQTGEISQNMPDNFDSFLFSLTGEQRINPPAKIEGIQFIAKDLFCKPSNEYAKANAVAVCYDEFEYLFDGYSASAVSSADAYFNKTNDHTPIVYVACFSPYYTADCSFEALFEKTAKSPILAIEKIFDETGIDIPLNINEIYNQQKQNQSYEFINDLLKDTFTVK